MRPPLLPPEQLPPGPGQIQACLQVACTPSPVRWHASRDQPGPQQAVRVVCSGMAVPSHHWALSADPLVRIPRNRPARRHRPPGSGPQLLKWNVCPCSVSPDLMVWISEGSRQGGRLEPIPPAARASEVPSPPTWYAPSVAAAEGQAGQRLCGVWGTQWPGGPARKPRPPVPRACCGRGLRASHHAGRRHPVSLEGVFTWSFLQVRRVHIPRFSQPQLKNVPEKSRQY